MNRCPGGELRNLHVEDVTCPRCGTSVELFSDEQRRRCPACGTRVTRVTVPACVAWCASAKQCLGPERFAEALESGIVPGEVRPDRVQDRPDDDADQ